MAITETRNLPAPFIIGKTAKRIIQTAVGAPIAIVGASKVKEKLKKKDKK
jgi:precorrin isomerase